jgi:dTDP-4-amino-4,6-dideoxygalactose transaminase
VLSRPRRLGFPFDDPRARVTNLGRNALWYGLRALGLGEGDEILMPAYHCGSEVAPVVELGIVPRFWQGDVSFEPDPEELEPLLGSRTRGLYLIHHLGLAHEAPRWRRWCDERGLLLFEDAAPGWPAALAGKPLGSWGDLALFSPWKTFGLPDCGVVLCSPPAAVPPPSAEWPTRELAKGFLRWPLQRLSLGAALQRRGYESPPALPPSVEFTLHHPERGVSKASLALLGRLAGRGAAPRRAANWDWLLERLGERMPAAFRRPAGEGCPFGFPFEAGDKRRFLARLAEHGIAGLDYWAASHTALPVGAFPEVDRMRREVAVLPVHQELRHRDLERVARAALAWDGRKI